MAYAYDWWLQRAKAEERAEEGRKAVTKRLERYAKMIEKDRAKRAKRTWQLTEDFQSYAGKYHNQAWGTVKVEALTDALRVEIGNLHCVATPYTAENSIRIELVPGSGEVILFKVEEGKVPAFVYDGDTFERRTPPE